MSLPDWLLLPDWILAIEFVGALLVVGYCLRALWALVRSRSIVVSRLIVADGVIMGLSFKLAATLLKTIYLHTWSQILMLASILALRTIVKRLFTWERDRLARRLTPRT